MAAENCQKTFKRLQTFYTVMLGPFLDLVTSITSCMVWQCCCCGRDWIKIYEILKRTKYKSHHVIKFEIDSKPYKDAGFWYISEKGAVFKKTPGIQRQVVFKPFNSHQAIN